MLSQAIIKDVYTFINNLKKYILEFKLNKMRAQVYLNLVSAVVLSNS